MARTIPETRLRAPAFEYSPAESRYQFHVLTARYGGGVFPGMPDDLTPFRVPEMRGCMRFWWRATRGGNAANKTELLERESRIWGSSASVSPTLIRVEEWDSGSVVEALKVIEETGSRPRYQRKEPAYVLFPAQRPDNPGCVSEKGSFTLAVSHQANASPFEVEAALWAWTNFGGYGARIRRGAGAIFSPQFCFPVNQRPVLPAVCEWLAQQARKYLTRSPGQSRPWPILAGAEVLLKPQALTPDHAWLECIRIYRDFRQSRSPGSGKRPGRSRWPEPDQIRRERRTNQSLHQPVHPEQHFPRAIFGLPIVFHFKDHPHGDPADQILEPQTKHENHQDGQSVSEGGRMASPMILKPLIVSPILAFPMIVRLNCDVFVKGSEANKMVSDLWLKQEKPKVDSRVKLGPRRADEEFLQQVEKNWWKTKRFVL